MFKSVPFLLSCLSFSVLFAGGPAWSMGDPGAGRAIFARCAVCHSALPGHTKFGPSLFGVVGRKAGTLDQYPYSEAMKSFAQTWTNDELFTYLAGPQRLVPGTKMTFPGVPDTVERADVIAYLDTLK